MADPNVIIADRLSRQRAQNPKKLVKMFAFERRHVNRADKFVEVERTFVLSSDTPILTEDDIMDGINFEFVPFEVVVNRATPLGESFSRILRMNFEVALSQLRRFVEEEMVRKSKGVMPGNVSFGSGIRLNDSLLLL